MSEPREVDRFFFMLGHATLAGPSVRIPTEVIVFSTGETEWRLIERTEKPVQKPSSKENDFAGTSVGIFPNAWHISVDVAAA